MATANLVSCVKYVIMESGGKIKPNVVLLLSSIIAIFKDNESWGVQETESHESNLVLTKVDPLKQYSLLQHWFSIQQIIQ